MLHSTDCHFLIYVDCLLIEFDESRFFFRMEGISGKIAKCPFWQFGNLEKTVVDIFYFRFLFLFYIFVP